MVMLIARPFQLTGATHAVDGGFGAGNPLFEVGGWGGVLIYELLYKIIPRKEFLCNL